MLTRIENPAGTVIGLTDLKTRIRAATGAEEDRTLLQLLAAATQRYESFSGRTMLPTRFDESFCGWGSMILSAYPLREVEQVTYIDADGAEQTLDPADWEVREIGAGWHAVFLAETASQPSLAAQALPVTVRYAAGYDDPDEPVSGGPAHLEQAAADVAAIVRILAWAYDNGAEMSEEDLRRSAGHRRLLR